MVAKQPLHLKWTKYLEERDRILDELKNQLSKAQQHMKANADVHRRDVKLENGEKVIGNKVEAHDLPEGLSDEMEMLIQPEEVKGIREGKTKSDDKEVLIRWKNLPEHDATWEPMATIQRQFPDFHLEDALVIMYGRREHLVDVTEIFNQLNWEKKQRLIKLGYIIILIFITLFWMIANALDDDVIMWFAKRFLHPASISLYRYVFFWNEDLGVQHFNPRRYVSRVMLLFRRSVLLLFRLLQSKVKKPA
ncbi:cornichon homolog 4-like protein [Tanacetum coccineum]